MMFLVTLNAESNPKNYLNNCFNKQVKPLGDRYLCLSYNENSNELGHDMEPWKQTNYIMKGTVWSTAYEFCKYDTLTRSDNSYYSKTQFDKTTLLVQDYGNEKLLSVSANMLADYIFETARYSPMMLIDYFKTQKPDLDSSSNQVYAVYKLIVNKKIVKLYIRKGDNLLEKAVTIRNDDMLGDVTDTYFYEDYSTTAKVYSPAVIEIEKFGGKVNDKIIISSVELTTATPVLLSNPFDYILKDETKTNAEVTTEKYNDNIYFVTLKHTESKSAIVVFKDFLMVLEAPLSSANGELILNEARKIAPGKPVKYFAFSHHHPWYLGGVRPFIRIGVTILTVKDDIPYLEYLASAKHTLQPDSLEIHPVTLKTEEVGMNKTITDGNYKMEIYFIGDRSVHTKDYLLFYFPAEKLLVEGDLAWILEKGELKKAGKRQAGLYNAIKSLGIDVETIIQEWPVGDKYGVKSVIPFSELEESVNIK